jgi:hypothetical protein
LGLLWGIRTLPDATKRGTSPGAASIIDKFAAPLLSAAYATLGHCVQNSLKLS